jgi:hypothetical protein
MSIWADIYDRSTGETERKEDSIQEEEENCWGNYVEWNELPAWFAKLSDAPTVEWQDRNRLSEIWKEMVDIKKWMK